MIIQLGYLKVLKLNKGEQVMKKDKYMKLVDVVLWNNHMTYCEMSDDTIIDFKDYINWKEFFENNIPSERVCRTIGKSIKWSYLFDKYNLLGCNNEDIKKMMIWVEEGLIDDIKE